MPLDVKVPNMLTIRRFAACLIAGLLGVLTAVAQAQDDPPGRVGRIAVVEGGVWVFDGEQREWIGALRNRPLTQGDRLATDAASSVELRIGSTTLLLGARSELQALRLDDQRMLFQLYRGSLALRVSSNEVAAEIEVLSAEGAFAPQGSGAYRIDRFDDGSFASVWRGELWFAAPDLRLALGPGQRAQFWREGVPPALRSRWLEPVYDDFASAFVRLDEADARAVTAQYVSPEMTGVEDLGRYGQWQQNPEVGAVWIPTQVSLGWAPYRHGHWAWVRPWGWTWVDDAAWGFAPFHYGRWLYWGNRWCWAPGPRGPRPIYAPALVAWVGDPGYRVGIAARSMPAAGWVPLAPHEAFRPGYHASPGYVDRLNNGRRWEGRHANRGVPGAVTLLPPDRQVPRQPVPGAMLRGDAGNSLQGNAHDRRSGYPPSRTPPSSWGDQGATTRPDRTIITPRVPMSPAQRDAIADRAAWPNADRPSAATPVWPFKPAPDPAPAAAVPSTAPAQPSPTSREHHPFRGTTPGRGAEAAGGGGAPPNFQRERPPPMRAAPPQSSAPPVPAPKPAQAPAAPAAEQPNGARAPSPGWRKAER